MQMRHEYLGRRLVAEAFSWLIVEMASQIGQVLLRDRRQVRIAWHEATDALVGVFHGAFLPWGAGIAEPTACSDAIFQSPEAGKLRAAVESKALTGKGR